MVLRTCICSNVSLFDIRFTGEERLIIRCADMLEPWKMDSFIDYLSNYSKKYDVIVFCYVKIKRKEVTNNILVFDKGKITCIVGSIEEGAKNRKVYKKTALCVGKDFLSPLNMNLLLGCPELMIAITDEKMDREWVKGMYAYKNISMIPVIIGFENGFFLIDGKITFLGRENFNFIKKPDSNVLIKKGYTSVCVID